MLSGTTELTVAGIDLLVTGLAIGATVWFFFIQSPALYRTLARERFVPMQMRLAKLLFSSLLVAQLIATALGLLGTTLALLSAAVGALIGALNRAVLFPIALKAGAASQQSHEEEGATGSATRFVTVGAGRKATVMHRVVVFCVLLMTAAALTHGYAVLHSLAA